MIKKLIGNKRHLVTGERLHGTVRCCYVIQERREWIWECMHKYSRELAAQRQAISDLKSELSEIKDDMWPAFLHSRLSKCLDPSESF